MGVNQNINKEIKELSKENLNENIIIGIMKIEKDLSNETIINSYENAKRDNPELRLTFQYAKKNEKEIKDCEIYINEKRINFNYYFNFPKKGNYTIKYIFKKLLTSTSFMFFCCK